MVDQETDVQLEELTEQQDERQKGKGTGIGKRLYLAFAGGTLITLLAVGISWFAFQNLSQTINKLTTESIPGIEQSQELAVESASISSIAPTLVTASTEDERASIRKSMTESQELVSAAIANMGFLDETARGELEWLKGELDQQLAALDVSVQERLATDAVIRREIETIRAAHAAFLETVEPLVQSATDKVIIAGDDEVNTSSDVIRGLIEEEVVVLQEALQSSADGQKMLGLISRALPLEDPAGITEMETAFAALWERHAERLPKLENYQEARTLADLAEKLAAIGTGKESAFALRKRELDWANLTPEQYDATVAKLKKINGDVVTLATELDQAVDPLVDRVRRNLEDRSSEMGWQLGGAISTLIEEDAAQIRQFIQIQAESNLAVGLMNAAASAPDLASLDTGRAAFSEAEGKITSILTEMNFTEERNAISDAVNVLFELGNQENSIFVLRQKLFTVSESANEALGEARSMVSAIDATVNSLVEQAREGAGIVSTEARTAIEQSQLALVALLVASIIGSILIGWIVVSRMVVSRLVRLSDGMSELADGNLDIDIDASGSDEISRMARTVETFRDNARQVEKMREDQERAEAAATEQRRQEMEKLAQQFEASVKGIVEQVSGGIEDMARNAESMSSAAANAQQ